MICPYCSSNDDKVIDSRASEAGRVIRRRRQCLNCGKRYTTYERVEETTRMMVIKRDGSRVPFSRENVLRGIAMACGKRPVPEEVKVALAEELEDRVHREFDREVDSREIGELVAQRLKDIDEIAYVRFASEYYQFRNVGDILKQLEEMNERVRDVPNQQPLFDGRGEERPREEPNSSGGRS
ncbi:MAG: transcriptional regulator NrdR [Phycisphaerales bacterium]